MQFITNLYDHIPVTFMERTIHMTPDDFQRLGHFRDEAINAKENRFYQDGMRWGFYSIQKPTRPKPNGELCPTEVITHMDSATLQDLLLKRDLLLKVWRDPETNFPIIGVPD